MKSYLVATAIVSSFLLSACAGSEANTKSAIQYSIQYEETGLAKYDNLFAESQELIGQLDSVDHSINAIVPQFKTAGEIMLTAAGAVAALKELDTLEKVWDYLSKTLEEANVQLDMAADAGGVQITVTADDPALLTKLKEAVAELNKTLKTLEQAPAELAGVAEKAVPLGKKVAALLESAEKDFTGMNARKLPATIDAIKLTGEELGKAPERVETIVASATKLVEELKQLGNDVADADIAEKVQESAEG